MDSSKSGRGVLGPACGSSLLSTHSFARYKKGTWEDFDDLVTPEEVYHVAWRCPDVPDTPGTSGTPDTPDTLSGPDTHDGDALSIITEQEVHDPRKSGLQTLKEKGVRVRSGETLLWAYPNDIDPLVVGHALLDLCPSEPCLSRKVHLDIEDENSDGLRASSGVSPKKRYLVTIGTHEKSPMPQPPSRWSPQDVLAAMDVFIEAKGLWKSTGCFHRAGVYAMHKGTFLVRVEDIGRHNCVDRLAGWSVLQGIPLSDKALLVSARMTSSLCAKAIRAGFPVIVSRSAVTTAAIAMAKEAGVTLIGFARTQEQRFTVFNQGKCGIYDE